MAKISNLDFYAILGVHPHAEDIVIRAAFKALAQRYHPDRFNGSKDEAHRRMADLTNAYETLADPARRRKYDRRRGLSARQARFYFKNPARERQPAFTAFALRAAARKAQFYRNAVYVLMVVVVILSAFNVHQHAAQIRELFAWNRASSGAISVATPGAATPAADGDAAAASATPSTTTTNVRILPIGQGTTRPIVPGAVEPQAPASTTPDATVAAPSPAPTPVEAPAPSPAAPTLQSPAPSP
ncbi:MAG TPA: J domain-containing protein, partial [Casimicrobiaceae bacterium]|nr:J domain-containing protein [Casimicrobiaceae bacterium]